MDSELDLELVTLRVGDGVAVLDSDSVRVID